MYDFTKNEMEIIKDNLQAFIANFGKPRITRGDDGESFYVFTDGSDSWRQYCYNIDYLNGWLYGCVQAACGNPKRDEEIREMLSSQVRCLGMVFIMHQKLENLLVIPV